MENLPSGIKYIRFVNRLTSVFLFIGAAIALILVVMGVIPGFLSKTSTVNAMGVTLLATISLILIGIFLIPGFLLIKINRGISRSNSKAKIYQTVISIFLLLLFPIWTILYGIALYFLWFDSETVRFFQKESL